MKRRFEVRPAQHAARRGCRKQRTSGRAGAGRVVFVDADCKPEPGAVERLVADVEELRGEAVVSPSIANLDVASWQTNWTRSATARRALDAGAGAGRRSRRCRAWRHAVPCAVQDVHWLRRGHEPVSLRPPLGVRHGHACLRDGGRRLRRPVRG